MLFDKNEYDPLKKKNLTETNFLFYVLRSHFRLTALFLLQNFSSSL